MPNFKVVFVRHGESEWNKKNLFCGWNDVDLSETGKWEATEITAATLKKENFQFDIAFTSCLKRTNQTLEAIISELNCLNLTVHSSWRLNERHYGALTGFNKRQMADVYGEEQVQIWRRSFNVAPPPITSNNVHYNAIRFNPKFTNIKEDDFPDTETLETTMQRVVPFWTENIVPVIQQGKSVLIVAHGTSLRGLIKYIKGISDNDIMTFNLPNSIPFTIEFDENMKIISDIQFMANEKTVKLAMEKVAAIGK